MKKPRKLSAQEANRLAVQMQVLRIKLIEFSLRYTFNGKSFLFDSETDKTTLLRAKFRLTELYRVKTIHESAAYRDLPYLPALHGSIVEKIKEHYLIENGTIGFVEVKESSHGPSVVNHLWSKRTIKRRITKKLKTKQNGKQKKNGQKTTSRR